MNRTFARLLALALVLLASGSVGALPAAAAGGVEYRALFWEPFSETDTTCTGDTVDVAGRLMHSVVIVVDARAGLHVTANTRISATGTSTNGTSYVANGQALEAEYFAPGDVPSNGTFPFNFELVSNDGSPNLFVHLLWRITLNANGDVTTFIDSADVACR